jgi:hypothetical protein
MFAILSSCPIIVAPGTQAALIFLNQSAYPSDWADDAAADSLVFED